MRLTTRSNFCPTLAGGSFLREHFKRNCPKSIDDKALGKAMGLVHEWTDAAVPKMAGATDMRNNLEALGFSHNDKEIAM